MAQIVIDKKKYVLLPKSQILATRDDLIKEVSRLDLRISDSRSDIIKWLFIFWVGQVVATFGFILLFLKK